MKSVLFIITPQTPPEAAASCHAACLRLRGEGIAADVTVADPEADVQPDAPFMDALILSDHAQILKALAKQGRAVAGLQHAENTGTSFPEAQYVFSEPEEVDTDSYRKAWQRMRGLPWEILETPRLAIRESVVADVDAFYKIYAMPGMTDYMEGLFPDAADEKRYMRDYIRNVYGLLGFGVWTVIEKASGDIIGRCGFSIRNGFTDIELGFLIGTQWQGQGYAKEACRAVLAYGKNVLGIETVQSLVKEENGKSRRLLEGLGFREIKRVRAEEDIYGRAYPPDDGTGAHRTPASPARYGTYLLFVSGSG